MSVRYRAADGTEIICAGLTPGGDIEAGAVMTRTGTITMDCGAGTGNTANVVFDSPMPDANYLVDLTATAGGAFGVTTVISNKTVNGFDLTITRPFSSAITITFAYIATKTYTVQHAAQNAEDIANILSVIPSNATSANQLATQSDLENVEIDVDDVLDGNSENPVQNKVVKAAIDAKQNKTLDTPIVISGTTETTVEGALSRLATEGAAVAASNRNLLDNPWFTVNQRGWTSGTIITNQFCVDRWKMSSFGGTATIESTPIGLSFTLSATTARPLILQPVENPSDFIGKQFTMSAKLIINGVEQIVSGTATISDATGVNTYFVNNQNGITLAYYTNDKVFALLLTGFSSTVTVVALKLELGSHSTLALDTAPDYTTELLKCQRYFVRFTGAQYARTFGWFESATDARFLIQTAVPMRAVPALTTGGSFTIRQGGTDKATGVSSFSIRQTSTSNLQFSGACSGATAGYFATLMVESDGSYIDFSAEL